MARPAASFNADYGGIGQMLTSPEMQANMLRRGENIAKRAADTAPVGDPAKDAHPGRYRDSFHVSSGIQHGQTSRAYGEVSNDSPEAFYVEYGTSKQDAHHTLLDAAVQAGGD